VLIFAVAAAALVGVVGFLLPAHRSVERSITVQAPPQTIHPYVASFRTGWGRWSPFGQAEDPEMEIAFSGPDSGVGATQTWKSKRMADGSMTITQSDPATGVAFDLVMGDFTLKGRIAFEPLTEGTTRVTWIDEFAVGNNPYKRWMALAGQFVMGRGLELGLANLKLLAEASAPPLPR
jgi:hypothetical protein